MIAEANTGPAAPSPPRDGSDVEGLEGFRHHFADVNETTIHYVHGGSGPLIVLVHGFPYTWEKWRPIMSALAAAGYSVMAPDIRGAGWSARAEGGYSKANVAEDIRQIALRLTKDPINLVGSDIGMMIVYPYARDYPHEVRRLVMAEGLIPGFGLEELMNPAHGGYWHFGFHAQVDVAEMLTRDREEAYLVPPMVHLSTSPAAEHWARTIFLPHYRAAGGMRAAFKHYEAMIADGLENRTRFTGKLTMPVLALNGDTSMPPEQTVAAVRQVAANIETDVAPQSGHTFSIDNPDWTAQRLVSFFAET